MHDTLGSRFSGIAQYADGNAYLDTPAALRRRGARRTWMRRGVGSLLTVTAVTAAVVTFGLGQTGAGTPGTHPAVTALPASAQLTAYQSAVLSKAGVSQATVAALAGSGLTPAQIQILAQKITADMHKPGLTPAQIRALEEQKLALLSESGLNSAQTRALEEQQAALQAAGLTTAQQVALARQRLTAGQLVALQQAHLSAAQMAAIQRQQQALAASAATRQG